MTIACPKSVRIATPPDQEELFCFLWEAHEETRFAPKSEEKMRDVIVNATTVRKNPVFGIIRTPVGIEAAIGLYFGNWWYSNKSVLMSFTLYVHPECRRTGHLNDLRDFASWFADQIGMPLVLVHWGDENGHKARLMGRGATEIGQMFGRGLEAA